MALANKTCCQCFRSFRSLRGVQGSVNLTTLLTRNNSSTKKSPRVVQQHKYSHHPPFPYPEIQSPDAAKGFVLHLDSTGRSLLLNELQKYEEANSGEDGPIDVNRAQLRRIFMFNCVPFIGFGILDNMIMIIAGEYIDVTIGAALGISTMAAAALGNLVSDVAGVGSAGYVELIAGKLGMVHTPDITPAQATHRKTRWSVGLGRAIGISIGCLIGMFPLLFFDSKEEHKDSADGDSTLSPEKASESPAQMKSSKAS